MSWISEFGLEYAVPAVVTRYPGIVDISWHNDACPSFVLRESADDAEGPRLWVDHPDPQQREVMGARFTVQSDAYNVALETDDAGEALKRLREETESWQRMQDDWQQKHD